jgi:hypothetical protein
MFSIDLGFDTTWLVLRGVGLCIRGDLLADGDGLGFGNSLCFGPGEYIISIISELLMSV